MTTPQQLAEHSHAVVVAAAGCGKTELLAQAVSLNPTGHELILTHTHAGIRSLRDRLRRLKVPSRSYYLDTIAGFALRYTASFPGTSGCGPAAIDKHQWNEIYRGAIAVLSSDFARTILKKSYTGAYVDEYQDCTSDQHEIIMRIAECIPCRILGDPLQGIFEFSGIPLVEWGRQVFPHFERLPDLTIPWRWKDANPSLADWLFQVRQDLENGNPIDLSKAPLSVSWSKKTPDNQRDACFRALNNSGTTVAIHKWPNEAHLLARRLGGGFVSMEEIECTDLLEWADKFETTPAGQDLSLMMIDFARECLTAVSSELSSLKSKLEKGDLVKGKLRKYADLFEELVTANTQKDWHSILNFFEKVRQIRMAAVFRPEVWRDMNKAIRQKILDPTRSLRDIAWEIRDAGRIVGRPLHRRCVSRTLLVKGLEFEHCIVLNADALTAKELYVAVTRGRNSVTILSESRLLSQLLEN